MGKIRVSPASIHFSSGKLALPPALAGRVPELPLGSVGPLGAALCVDEDGVGLRCAPGQPSPRDPVREFGKALGRATRRVADELGGSAGTRLPRGANNAGMLASLAVSTASGLVGGKTLHVVSSLAFLGLSLLHTARHKKTLLRQAGGRPTGAARPRKRSTGAGTPP
ncbi:MAG: hypothetical protein Kow0092_28450 [Deferrisomatales bacterium]